MSQYFCLAFRFLEPVFHGRADGNRREWPPSPLRAFQALVAAAGRRQGGELTASARAALEWLEGQAPPVVISPNSAEGSGYCLSVPNNAMDIVARAWCRGNYSNSGDASPATHRTMKVVRPMLLSGDATAYLWPVPDPLTEDVGGHITELSEIALSVAALGWGTDMAVGYGSIVSQEEVAGRPGERWVPMTGASNDGLRVPVAGTLEDLMRRHTQFLGRLGPEGLVPPTPLSVYRKIEYRPAADPPPRSMAAFSLLKMDASGFRAFDAARRGLTLAGMVRSATKLAAKSSGWPEAKISAFVLGHGESDATGKHVAIGPRRFAYVPLPTIESRGNGKARVVGNVRRVMLTCFVDSCQDEVVWVRRTLSNQTLIDERSGGEVALLSVIPANDKVVQCYTRGATTWATVTPVVLPGYDDPDHLRRRAKDGRLSFEQQRRMLERLSNRIEGLLRKAIAQAGFSQELADHAELEWRKVGFWPGTDLADRYGAPDHLKRFPRFHVKIKWRDAQNRVIEVPGPLCIGGGRYYGLGLLAAL